MNNLFGQGVIQKYFESHMEIHGETQFHGIPSFIHCEQGLLHQEIVLHRQVNRTHGELFHICILPSHGILQVYCMGA